MPLQSEAQRKYLWANEPDVARKFEAETPKGKKLPARKKRTEHVADETEVVELKDFSDKEREKLVKKHEAMPGGGFPIRNGSDLRNAIQAVGRAKNPSAARAWIIKRAKELKLTDQLPGGWELAARVDALELAVIALGTEEFGDTEGHPFHGNQWTQGGGDSVRDLSGNRKAPSDVVVLHQHAQDKSVTDAMPSSSKYGGSLGYGHKADISAGPAADALSSAPQGIDVHAYPSGVEIHNDYNGFQTGVDRVSYQDALKTADALRSAKADTDGVVVRYAHNENQSAVRRYSADQALKLADKLEQAAKSPASQARR